MDRLFSINSSLGIDENILNIFDLSKYGADKDWIPVFALFSKFISPTRCKDKYNKYIAYSPDNAFTQNLSKFIENRFYPN